MNVDSLNILDLAEDPDRLERAMAEQQENSRTDPATRNFMEQIFLEEDRASSFARFLASLELRTILGLFDTFKIDRSKPTCEIGGGPGFLSWAMSKSGFTDIHLLEPNSCHITGTGYLRTREDAKAIRIHNDPRAWHKSPERFDLIVTKNCIHHFKNISQAAAAIRQKMKPNALWFAFREAFADNTRELYEQLTNHPFSQRYGLYEWFYPASHYVESLEIAGFKMRAVVPLMYANNTLCRYQEEPGGPDILDLTRQIDGMLAVNPQITVDSFWQEILQNRFQNGNTKFFSRPQAMIFEVAPI